MSINLENAEKHPELAKALIMAIFPKTPALLNKLWRSLVLERQ